VPFFHRQSSWVNLTVTSIGSNWHNPAAAQFSTQRITIVTFVQAKPLRTAATFANFDAIDRGQNVDLVMAIRFAQGEVQWIAVCIYHQMAFEAVNTVLS
jgi:hypothetical protein